MAAGLSPKTVRNHLGLLGLMFRQAQKWWVSENPLELVDPPPLDDAEMEMLTAAKVARLRPCCSARSRAARTPRRLRRS